ncbi:hypothetical protein [Pontimicrobium sp. SW4]|uniref:NERD domain-containing protein n=1 Tax=Pontimicrobium sp. SW4 TaxID=3153519 RepID=A0AAU7BUA8_9FLAO
MILKSSPTYSDVFNESEPDIDLLLKDLPSKMVITILGYINSELYLSSDNKIQIKIFEKLTRRFDSKTKILISNNIRKLVKEDLEINFFSVKINLEFMHHVLIHYVDGKYSDSTPINELNFFKSYLIITKKINEKYKPKDLSESPDKHKFFREYLWPVIVDQIDINQTESPVVGLVKGLNLLNYFSQSEYSNNLEIFLTENKEPDIWNYIVKLLNLLQNSWNKLDSEIPPFLIEEDNLFHPLFDTFILDENEYKKIYSSDSNHYSGLKNKPLIKNKKKLIISNWGFISNKLYEGLIFDFYNKSAIKNHPKFEKFVDYKNLIAQEVTEKRLFKKLLSKYLKNKNSVLEFDDNKEQGFPDAYFRNGKHVFLFEIKDAYFANTAIKSYSYKKIKEEIDKKYNSKRKGTGQIIKHLKKLRDKPFEDKSYSEIRIKPKNLVIYPIIIFTSHVFESPGFNKYLIKEFENKLMNENLQNSFGQIKNLTFMNISFLINNLSNRDKFTFKEVIDFYHNRIKAIEKKDKKLNSLDLLHESNNNFEYFSKIFFTKKKLDISKPIFKEIVETLELKNT